MALPVVALARGSVVIGGETVEFRALSRAEAMVLNGYKGREDEAEVQILQWGTGCTEEEAQTFREGNDTLTAGLLIDGIIELSGLVEAGFIKSTEADVPVDPKRSTRKRS